MLFFVLILSILQICTAHEEWGEVTNLAEGIKNLIKQASTYVYQTDSSSFDCPNRDPNEVIDEGDYHFIICGGGTAGSVLANRLAQHSEWKILVLEAGGPENDVSNVPKMARNLHASDFNWGFKTTSQKNGFDGYIDNSLRIAAGKAIGGSSVLDIMLYSRGNKADYDKWCASNPGWSYPEILEIFKSLENATIEDPDLCFRGTEGEIKVSYGRVFDETGRTFLKSCQQFGLDDVDYNAKIQIGASRIQLIQNDGKRKTSANLFLKPVQHHPNVKIISNCLITKVLIDENKIAFGVEYLRNGLLRRATACNEVILSTGPIKTPHILMLSGIGPAHHLEEHNINVIQDLPVGSYLWDQIVYPYLYFQINKSNKVTNIDSLVREYVYRNSGPLTAPLGLQAVAFDNVSGGKRGKDVPDVLYLFSSDVLPFEDYPALKNLDGITEETYNSITIPICGISTINIPIVLLHPLSTGTVRLKSNSYLDFPLIDPRYLSHPEDINVMVKGIKKGLKILNAEAFRKFNSTFISLTHPKCKNYNCNSDEFWKCMISTLSKSFNTFSGTARMGPYTDRKAVVDNNLKVHGIHKLSICDSSVIPVTLSGTTNSISSVIAEKLYQRICSEHLSNADSDSGGSLLKILNL